MTVEFLIATALEGLIITSLGLLVYSTGFRFFKSIDNEFDSKETAQVTVVIFLIAAGILGNPLLEILRQTLSQLQLIQQFGFLIISSRWVVNSMVNNWRFDDSLSIYVYVLGLASVLYPLI